MQFSVLSCCRVNCTVVLGFVYSPLIYSLNVCRVGYVAVLHVFLEGEELKQQS